MKLHKQNISDFRVGLRKQQKSFTDVDQVEKVFFFLFCFCWLICLRIDTMKLYEILSEMIRKSFVDEARKIIIYEMYGYDNV
jgi:hypothetical protein